MTEDEAATLKVGDEVLCVSTKHTVSGDFIVGNTYKIVGTKDFDCDYEPPPRVKGEGGKSWNLWSHYLEDFSIIPAAKFKPGDKVRCNASYPWRKGRVFSVKAIKGDIVWFEEETHLHGSGHAADYELVTADFDLVNVPAPTVNHRIFCNLYPDRSVDPYSTQEAAEDAARTDAIRVAIECELKEVER